MKKENNKIFKLKLTSIEENLTDALAEHGRELSITILDNITHAIDNNIETVRIGVIETPFHTITLKCSRDNYLETLEQNMKKFIDHEDYERCIICKKYIDLLKKDLEDKK